MDVRAYNRAAWNAKVDQRDRWTVPVSSDQIRRARAGEFSLLLTPSRPVPMTWFPDFSGTRTLCLASGGGQQGPLLAAAGAEVTVFDNSPRQLEQDRFVAKREGLDVKTVEGDMADLSIFPDSSFQLIVHPCSNCFAQDVRAVWKECFRVLSNGGILLAGFANPVRYLFGDEQANSAPLIVQLAIPYSDLDRAENFEERDGSVPLEFGHSLEDQIGGQIDAGFVIGGFYEDRYEPMEGDPLSRFIDTFIATRAIKPQ